MAEASFRGVNEIYGYQHLNGLSKVKNTASADVMLHEDTTLVADPHRKRLKVLHIVFVSDADEGMVALVKRTKRAIESALRAVDKEVKSLHKKRTRACGNLDNSDDDDDDDGDEYDGRRAVKPWKKRQRIGEASQGQTGGDVDGVGPVDDGSAFAPADGRAEMVPTHLPVEEDDIIKPECPDEN